MQIEISLPAISILIGANTAVLMSYNKIKQEQDAEETMPAISMFYGIIIYILSITKNTSARISMQSIRVRKRLYQFPKVIC
jgi:hypothetical protein